MEFLSQQLVSDGILPALDYAVGSVFRPPNLLNGKAKTLLMVSRKKDLQPPVYINIKKEDIRNGSCFFEFPSQIRPYFDNPEPFTAYFANTIFKLISHKIVEGTFFIQCGESESDRIYFYFLTKNDERRIFVSKVSVDDAIKKSARLFDGEEIPVPDNIRVGECLIRIGTKVKFVTANTDTPNTGKSISGFEILILNNGAIQEIREDERLTVDREAPRDSSSTTKRRPDVVYQYVRQIRRVEPNQSVAYSLDHKLDAKKIQGMPPTSDSEVENELTEEENELNEETIELTEEEIELELTEEAIELTEEEIELSEEENELTEEDANNVQRNIIKLKDHIFPVGTIYQPKADLFDTIYKHPIRKNLFENSAVYIYDTTKEPQTTMDQLYPGFFANRKIKGGPFLMQFGYPQEGHVFWVKNGPIG